MQASNKYKYKYSNNVFVFACAYGMLILVA